MSMQLVGGGSYVCLFRLTLRCMQTVENDKQLVGGNSSIFFSASSFINWICRLEGLSDSSDWVYSINV